MVSQNSEDSTFGVVIGSIQAVMSAMGFFGNAITYVLLLKHQVPDMTPLVRQMLRHQALVGEIKMKTEVAKTFIILFLLDAIICIMATIHIIQPVMFMLGIPALDLFICQCWHGQAIYWAMIFVSVYNLVVIAFERFLAICRPLHLDILNERRLKIVISFIFLYSFTIGQAGSYFQVSTK